MGLTMGTRSERSLRQTIVEMDEVNSGSIKSTITKKLRHFKFKDIRRMSSTSWLIIIYFTFLANCFNIFSTFGKDLLEKRFGYSFQKSKNIISVLPLVDMVLIVGFSIFTNKYGKKPFVLISASLVAVATFIGMTYIPEHDPILPIVGVVGVSLFQSLMTAAIWSSFTISVPRQAFTFMLAALISN